MSTAWDSRPIMGQLTVSTAGIRKDRPLIPNKQEAAH